MSKDIFTNHKFYAMGNDRFKPIKCKYCNIIFINYQSYVETLILPNCISSSEQIIKDLLE